MFGEYLSLEWTELGKSSFDHYPTHIYLSEPHLVIHLQIILNDTLIQSLLIFNLDCWSDDQ